MGDHNGASTCVFGHGPRAQLRALGRRPQKRLSQSFLKDQRVAVAIVRAARLTPDSEVLEVGPGLGVLTRLLATQARRVVAIELDAALAEALRAEMPNVAVVNEDILNFEAAEHFARPYAVVANLPYHITSPALRHLLSGSPERLVVMVQAEVAERIAAKPGDMSALAVTIQAQAQVRIARRVGAESFYPRPKVDSAVLVLEPRPRVERNEIESFTALVQAGFKQPRKTLANSLADGLQLPKAQAIERLRAADIEPRRRPQELRLEDWLRLFRSTL